MLSGFFVGAEKQMQYAILGGGILGLTAALRLAERGMRVTVFEKETAVGGLTSGFLVGDVWLERFYHHIFRSDRAITRLIDEMGLSDRLAWSRPLTSVLRGGQAYQLDSPSSLLRFPPLRAHERIRMAAGMAILRYLPSPGILEGRVAASWIRRWMGRGPYELVWQPLLNSKFGPLSEQIALPWFWGRLHDRSAELGYLRGGFQLLYARLADCIRERGGQLRLGTEVTGVVPEPDGRLAVSTATGKEMFDGVISTLPTRLTCRLTPALPAQYRARYDWGNAYGAHCLILALDRRLTESYWININDPGYPFIALVEHTNYQDLEQYGGRHLVYLGNYRAMNDPLFDLSEDSVRAEFLPYLKRINPRFEPSWVTESWMFKAPYAQPIVTTEYRSHIPPFETPIPGLYVANMFQVYPHDRGQNYSVDLAERLVSKIGANRR
ncbi:MAG: NAD(P)/FAD-dependent oxidoreductase [Chloroflexota bacterium]|nr:MAG: NAD(P)/FAD-dependent oxidoreductase [Chloroflexota bacterium]